MHKPIAITKPRIVAFEITRRCRYHCHHCRAAATWDDGEKDLATAQCIGILKGLAAYCFNPFMLVPTGRGADLESEMIDPAEYEELLFSLVAFKKNSMMDLSVTCGPQFRGMLTQMAAPEVSRSRRSRGCPAGGEFAFINYRGDVQTCGFLEISAGNLIDVDYDFGMIWEQSPLLSAIRDRSLYTGVCGECPDLEVCGGCRARALTVNGDYLASDPVCSRPISERINHSVSLHGNV